MRGFSVFAVLLLLSCVSPYGIPFTPDQSPKTYFRVRLGEACNYVPLEQRPECFSRAPVERTFRLYLRMSEKTPIGLAEWTLIPLADYWRNNYFASINGGWDFYNRPNRYLPGNCVYRIPVTPGSGRYLLFLDSNLNSDMSLRLDINLFATLTSSGEQGRDIGGARILYIPEEINPGESLTFEFDPYDLKKYTYSIDATPEKEEECIIDPGFGD